MTLLKAECWFTVHMIWEILVPGTELMELKHCCGHCTSRLVCNTKSSCRCRTELEKQLLTVGWLSVQPSYSLPFWFLNFFPHDTCCFEGTKISEADRAEILTQIFLPPTCNSLWLALLVLCVSLRVCEYVHMISRKEKRTILPVLCDSWVHAPSAFGLLGRPHPVDVAPCFLPSTHSWWPPALLFPQSTFSKHVICTFVMFIVCSPLLEL